MRGVLLVILMSLCHAAQAGSLVLSAGMARIGHHEDNHYFQLRYPHENAMDSFTFSLGYRVGRWLISYEYLGEGETKGYADPDDGNYNPDLKSSVACKKACIHNHFSELPYWYGEGEIHAVSLLYTLVKDWYGFGLEGGVLAFRPTWEQWVFSWYPAGQPEARSDIKVAHKPTVSFAPAVNVYYKFSKNVAVLGSIRGPLNQGGDFAPNFHNMTYSVSVRFETE